MRLCWRQNVSRSHLEADFHRKGMTRVRRRLIEDFLLPALNDRRYGDRLKWEDKEKNCFSIRWSHKNAAKWSLEDTVVFQDWDRMKGHFRPECKGYYMQAKQRFRAALYKLATVKILSSDDKHIKKYELVLDNEKRKNPNNSTSKVRSKRFCPNTEGQRSIPTSVICRNDSYYEHQPQFSYDQLPQSPTSSTKSDYSNYNDDSLDSPENSVSSSVAQESLNDRKVMKPTGNTCTESESMAIDSFHRATMDCAFEMLPIKCEPVDNDYEMVSIKQEPMDENFEMPPTKSKHLPIQLEMIPIKREPVDDGFNETIPARQIAFSDSISINRSSPLQDSQFRTLDSDKEEMNVTELKAEATPLTDEILRGFAPKLRAKYLAEGYKKFLQCKISSVVPNICKQYVQNREFTANNNLNSTSSEGGAPDRKHTFSMGVNLELPEEKKSLHPVIHRSNPHVPIPPLPGYSKTDNAVRPLDNTHRRVLGNQHKNKCMENNIMVENNDQWSEVGEPAISSDGALNLCIKPVNHINEKTSCTDR